ncbi:MAG: hypothetical protein M3P82_04720, partial [Bacteroidota bacterium]|nr:hypothetical protein [Bacteroidota bacterium]
MSKELLLTVIILIAGLLIMSFTFSDDDPDIKFKSIQTVDSKLLDGNNISTWFTNNGSFNRNPMTSNSGFEWPRGSGKILTYHSGLCISGKVGSDTLVAVSKSTGLEYAPGYIDGNGNPQGKDDNAYRIYKIVKGDTISKDYTNWPVTQGAYLDSNSKPFLPGKQTLFYCMTDGYPEFHNFTNPMKAQVQVTSWCYNSVSDPVISNTIFSEFKIINKKSSAWNDAVISIWSDQC